ncbi:MAG TPA: NADPH-dependent FMN reductase [Polyangiaceae bacterium]|nr:NADPH-dependent FMN reductase [Polyangiaceae bacterium]
MQVVTLCGSLRARSYNAALARALSELAPASFELVEGQIDQLPLYNDDVQGHPAVLRLREQVDSASAVLIVSPEYNFGIPGPLKNALDWVSRPAFQSPFAMKPVGLLGASGGLVGTARAQGQLKQVLLGMAAQVFPHSEILVGQAPTKFDEELRLVDETTRKLVTAYLAAFERWAAKVG